MYKYPCHSLEISPAYLFVGIQIAGKHYEQRHIGHGQSLKHTQGKHVDSDKSHTVEFGVKEEMRSYHKQYGQRPDDIKTYRTFFAKPGIAIYIICIGGVIYCMSYWFCYVVQRIKILHKIGGDNLLTFDIEMKFVAE